MPCSKERKQDSLFVNPISSRDAIHLTLLSLLISSSCFPLANSGDVQTGSSGIRLCYDVKAEGHRLNTTAHIRLYAWHEIDCAIQCVHNTCCRSVNYKKSLRYDGKENCELLHAVVSEQSENLKENEMYDYLILNEPSRSFNCSCSSCQNGGTCNETSKKCDCPSGFTGILCETDEYSSSPCHKNAEYEEAPGDSYTCKCEEEYVRNRTLCNCNLTTKVSFFILADAYGWQKLGGSLNSSLLLEGNCTLLSELYKWLGNRTQWCLCYGAYQRDWNATTFHSKCDNKSHTVTIVRSTDGDIVGGYSDIPWSAKDDVSYPKTSHSAFLFSLKNENSSKSFQLPLKTSQSQNAIYSCSNCGPVFGGGHDLYIASEACNANKSLNSYINLNVTYQLPSDVDNQDTFVEKKDFCLSLIEVFYEC